MGKAKEVLKLAKEKLAPPPNVNPCEWADQQFYLSPEYTSEPGKYSSDRTPYQKEPLAMMSKPGVHRVVLQWGSQLGKTLMEMIAIGYFVDIKPSPMLFVQPTIETAEGYSKERIAPMIRDTPALQDKFGNPRSRDSGNTVTNKSFPGGHLAFVGSNSPAGLASRPIRVVLMDEVDRWESDVGGEGDPVNLATKRTATFFDWLVVMVSTPDEEGTSRIEKAFYQGDQRYYHVPCPHCGGKQSLEWERLEYPHKGTDRAEPEKAQYRCCHCDELFSDSYKSSMLAHGEWVAFSESNYAVSYHLNELYSPWRLWADVASDYESAVKDGEAQLQVFWNTSLARTWRRNIEEKLDSDKLLARSQKSEYASGFCPEGCLLLTAGVDVQQNRLEVSIWGWGRKKCSWLILHTQILGDTGADEVWQLLEDFLQSAFPHASGAELKVKTACIDSGYRTQEVYYQVRRRQGKGWKAIKGKDGDRAIVSPPTMQELDWRGKKYKRGVQLYMLGVDKVKEDLLLVRAKVEDSEASKYINLPNDIDTDWAEGFSSEILVKKHRNGKPYYVWEQVEKDNHPLDTAVYAYGAAVLAGIERMNWGKLEASIRKQVEPKPDEPQKKDKVKPQKQEWVDSGGYWS